MHNNSNNQSYNILRGYSLQYRDLSPSTERFLSEPTIVNMDKVLRIVCEDERCFGAWSIGTITKACIHWMEHNERMNSLRCSGIIDITA